MVKNNIGLYFRLFGMVQRLGDFTNGTYLSLEKSKDYSFKSCGVGGKMLYSVNEQLKRNEAAT